MMQMSIVGDPQAIVDAEAYSEAHSDATKWDDTHEMKASTVECMCEQEVTLHREGRREAKGGWILKRDPNVPRTSPIWVRLWVTALTPIGFTRADP